jgi:CrcB protein
MRFFLLAALGGAIGAGLRYGVGLAAARFDGVWPWGTFIVNIAGGLAMGAIAAIFAGEARATMVFLGVGVLGGFTTFSAFSLEMARMIERGEIALAFAYACVSVLAALGACFVGLLIGRSLA